MTDEVKESNQVVTEVSSTGEVTVKEGPLDETPNKIEAISSGQRKRINRHTNQQANHIKNYLDAQSRKKRALQAELKALENTIGRPSYNALKDMVTVRQPEVKDESGNVVKKAVEQVNYRALLLEGRNLIATLRKERIASKSRKKTTGRGSDRNSHRAMVRFLNRRNEESKNEPVTKTHEIK